MNHDEADKETQTWLAILSGETVAEADPSMVFEAEALRAVLQCRLHPPQLNPKILDHVIVQLQKERLLQQKEGWIKQWQRVIIQQVIKFLPTNSIPSYEFPVAVAMASRFVVRLRFIHCGHHFSALLEASTYGSRRNALLSVI